MAKTRRVIKECLPQVDVVIELLDARIPHSSRNPDIEKIVENKPTLIILTKASLADPAMSKRWIEYYKAKGLRAVLCDSVTGYGMDALEAEINDLLKEKIARYKDKGMDGRKLKAMMVGIPNVGKSSLINRLAGAKKARVEDRPGVTVAKQWVPTSIGLDLLDMPGVLWPKFEDQTVGENLAMTGAIKDQILDTEGIAMLLCSRLMEVAPEAFTERYKLDRDEAEGLDGYDLFEMVGRRRGFLMSGGVVNSERCSAVLLDEFRGGKIGKITLEAPNA